jgi:hypothetical protein
VKLLFIGDIVGKPGRRAVKTLVPRLREQHGLDFVIANGENSAGGSGITPLIAGEIFADSRTKNAFSARSIIRSERLGGAAGFLKPKVQGSKAKV